MNTEREARRDAKEYARAQMFYGEGAGTRRKLITATVESKADRSPVYARAFRTELSHQDMADHAERARSERHRKDTAESVKKNTRALVSGNYQNVQSSVLLIIVAGYFAHKTGYDVKMYEKGKSFVADAKTKIKTYRNKKAQTVNPVDERKIP